jgi:putative glycosyltransferase (TIGR04372 family)
MKYWLLPSRPPVLVVRPRERSFGHQAYELLMGLHMARAVGGALALWRPRHEANQALFGLEAADVPTLGGFPRLVAIGQARLMASGQALMAWFSARQAAWQHLVLSTLERLQPRLPAARAWRKRYKGSLTAPTAAARQDYFGLDFRLCYARQPLVMRLPAAVDDQARGKARELGLEPARLVAVHARESGFKAGAGGESAADAMRNARIESYLPAIDRLIAGGFTVVRIGDSSMSPLVHAGVVDLATSAARTDALELWVLLHAALFVAGDSGPFAAAQLSPAPCLAVNVTNVLGGYPVRRSDRYILKRVFDRERDRELTLREMLDEEYFLGRKDLSRYRVIDNTADEIAAAVDEMLDVLEGRQEPSSSQALFHEWADAAYNSPVVAMKRTRKGEPARQLLGDGLLGRVFADQMLGQGQRMLAT